MTKKKVSKIAKKGSTVRQVVTAAAVANEVKKSEKGGKMRPLGTILRELGYSKKVCANPGRVIRRKGFVRVLNEMLPDHVIGNAQVLTLAASSHKQTFFNDGMSDDDIREYIHSVPGAVLVKIKEITKHSAAGNEYQVKVAYYTAPDYFSINRSLETIHKIKGNFKPEKVEHDVGGTLADIIKKQINGKKNKNS